MNYSSSMIRIILASRLFVRLIRMPVIVNYVRLGHKYLALIKVLSPVRKFRLYKKRYVITGQATIHPVMNIGLPARFIFVHNAGKDHRHSIEATFFGLSIMKVNERYVDGMSLFELPLAPSKMIQVSPRAQF